MKNLEIEGFRFVCRDLDFKWVHPLEMFGGDIDCTDMTEDDLLKVVVRVDNEIGQLFSFTGKGRAATPTTK